MLLRVVGLRSARHVGEKTVRALWARRAALAAAEGTVQVNLQRYFRNFHPSRRFRRTKMSTLTRRAAFIALATCAAVPAHAQTGRQSAEMVTLDRPAAFEIAPNTGSLKESVQKGQQLVWHPKEKPEDGRFQITNVAVAFLREQTGGQLKMTFAGNVSSLGYQTTEDAKLNVIVRAKGGASLHSWSVEISVRCGDKDRPLTPLTHDVPTDVAANVFTNVSTVEIAEPAEPNYRGVSVQRCS
jgi:hypothetical protein